MASAAKPSGAHSATRSPVIRPDDAGCVSLLWNARRCEDFNPNSAATAAITSGVVCRLICDCGREEHVSWLAGGWIRRGGTLTYGSPAIRVASLL